MLVVLGLFALARFVGRDRTRRGRGRSFAGAPPSSIPSVDALFDALPAPGAPIVVRQEGSSS
jgi:hypothetical protein